jgi:exoribonuclease R
MHHFIVKMISTSTEKKDDANKVERLVRISAPALLLESNIGRRLDAIVTGASEKRTWVRLFHLLVAGKLIRGVEILDVGDRVRVERMGIDVEQVFIDFARAGRGHNPDSSAPSSLNLKLF